MSFYGYHGETEAERTLGNRFHVDVEIRMDLVRRGPQRRHRRHTRLLACLRAGPRGRRGRAVPPASRRSPIASRRCLLAEPRVAEREGPCRQAATDRRSHRPVLGDHRAPQAEASRMSAVIVDGKAVAAELRAELTDEVAGDGRGRQSRRRRSRWSSAATTRRQRSTCATRVAPLSAPACASPCTGRPATAPPAELVDAGPAARRRRLDRRDPRPAAAAAADRRRRR